jgi:hypothetical protein
MKKIVFLITAVLLSYASNSQDPLYFTNTPLPCINRTFHVYVYIVKNASGSPVISDAKLDEYMDNLNKAFEPICISFEVCYKTFVDDYSYEEINDEVEVELLTSRFQEKRRINIYFATTVAASVNSYSTFNGIQNFSGAVLVVPANGKGLIHEMGHTFGLYHIFENKFGVETVDGTNCATAGDLICDTPAAPNYLPKTPIDPLDCEFTYDQKDPKGEYYRTEIGNYMSHYFCAHCFFTKEQYIRMAANYMNAPFKMW